MQWADWALIVSGGMVLAGIAYPSFAQSKAGWKVGAWSGGTWWALWYGSGGLAYLGGMSKTFGWAGLIAAVPVAFVVGFALLLTAKRHAQQVALAGPILANVWFMFP